MIFGVNTTKKAVFIAETHGAGKTFAVDRVRRIPFQLRQASDLADLLKNLSAILGHKAKRANRSVAILKPPFKANETPFAPSEASEMAEKPLNSSKTASFTPYEVSHGQKATLLGAEVRP
jgi:hypothetical protein